MATRHKCSGEVKCLNAATNSEQNSHSQTNSPLASRQLSTQSDCLADRRGQGFESLSNTILYKYKTKSLGFNICGYFDRIVYLCHSFMLISLFFCVFTSITSKILFEPTHMRTSFTEKFGVGTLNPKPVFSLNSNGVLKPCR